MKSLFKSKPRTPVELVRLIREILVNLDLNWKCRDAKREDKMMELCKLLREMKLVLYGNGQAEPVRETCSQITKEFFRENSLRLLIVCLPKLNLEARKDATLIVANLQRQQVQSRLIASQYLEENKDLMDQLLNGYEDMDLALHYGPMLRECIRHQTIARYVLESENMKKFFDYIELPNFDIGSDAAATFKELLTRHKSTVAEFLYNNYDWFFAEFNSKLLESPNYITRRQAIKLLKEILHERANSKIMMRYVCSKDNLILLMNLLKENSKSIPLDAFQVFKLFASNQNKPSEVVKLLGVNSDKLLLFLGNFTPEKDDDQFEIDRVQVIKDIGAL